jgi:cyclopropane fatty-acyl-phospholipid synthase-like methyltransferase
MCLNFGGLRSLKNKVILETGCGKGGGLNYLMSSLVPQKVVGTDIS